VIVLKFYHMVNKEYSKRLVFEFYIVHTPTNTLFMNLVKSF